MTQREATILVLGNFNDYAVQRLSGEFNIKRIPKGDAALVEAAGLVMSKALPACRRSMQS